MTKDNFPLFPPERPVSPDSHKGFLGRMEYRFSLPGGRTAPPRTVGVLQEVAAERRKQYDRWGQQDHPSFDLVLLEHLGGVDGERLCYHHEVPSEARAKAMCKGRFNEGHGTWGDILVEEVSEAIACGSDEHSLREELIQVAAVATAWIEALDRKHKRPDRG